MATINKRVGQAGKPAEQFARRIFMLELEIDFAKTNHSSADVLQLFDIKTGQRCLGMATRVDTKEGGTATVDAGDGDDVDGFLDGIDLNTGTEPVYSATALALVEAGPNTVLGYTAGKLYTTDDTLDLLLNNDLDKAKITVFAAIEDYTV